MKRLFAAGTAMLLAMGAASAAHAEMVTIDDFQTVATVSDNTTGDGANSTTGLITVDGRTFLRTLSVNQIENPDPNDLRQRSSLNVGLGRMFLNNDFDSNAIFTASYNIDSLVDDFDGASQLMLTIDGFDGAFDVPLTIKVELGDYEFSQTFTGPISNPDVDAIFNLPALADSGNELRISFWAGTGSDMKFLPIRIDIGIGNEEPVPEPAMIGLLGLGVAAVGFGRRRKVTA